MIMMMMIYILAWSILSRVFANRPGDPCHIIPKTLKMVLDTSLLNTQQYKVKWSNPGKGVAPSPISRCSSYWKESLLVALDFSHQDVPDESWMNSDESLSVDLSNTTWAQWGLINKLSGNAFDAVTRIRPVIIIIFGTRNVVVFYGLTIGIGNRWPRNLVHLVPYCIILGTSNWTKRYNQIWYRAQNIVCFFFCDNLLHSLIMWFPVSALAALAIFLRIIDFCFNVITPHRIVLCRYYKKHSISISRTLFKNLIRSFLKKKKTR